MIKKTLRDNAAGATLGLDYRPAQFDRGYAVSITDNPIHFRDITERQLKAEINRLEDQAKKLNLKKYFFGWWLDKKTGIGYLDLSLIFNNKRDALAVGRVFNQKAIFNFKTLQSLYI